MRPYSTLAFLFAAACAGAAQDTRLFDVSQPPYNAVGDGATDCSKAFQNALHDAGEGDAGGVVFVPRGQFLISEPLRMRPNTALRGVWTHPPNSPQFWPPYEDRALPGSVLLFTGGEGNADGPPAIAIHANCAVEGLVIHYPNQVKENPPRPYPWTIQITEGGADHCTIQNVLMVNPYQAVDFGTHPSGRHYIDNLYAYPLYRGLFIDQCYDIGRVSNVHFWPFWGYTGDDDPLGRFVSENAEAFIIGRTDWEYLNNCFAIFYHVGFHFVNRGAGGGNVLLTQSGADICPYAVLVEEVQGHSGVSFSNSQIFGRVAVRDTNSGPVRFTGCGFFGATREPEPREPVHFDIAGNGHVALENCHLVTLDPKNTATTSIRAAGGGLSVSNCQFMDVGRTHFDLRPGLRTAVILGNTFAGAMGLVNTSGANVQAGFNADQPAQGGDDANAVIVDNLDGEGGFATQGAWYIGKAGGDYRNAVHWAEAGDGGATATWRAELPGTGRYTVHAWYGDDPFGDRATDAPYAVRHAGGATEIRVNQRERTGQWVELGAFEFDAGPASVTLTNAANGNVLADAVRFVPAGEP